MSDPRPRESQSLLDTIGRFFVPVHRDGYKFLAGAALATLVLFQFSSPLGWLGGYAMISERRQIALPAGESVIRFEGVAAGMIPAAIHIPLAELRTRADELDRDRPVVVSCAGGWRSSVAASYLRAQGHTDVSDLLGGYNAWSAAHPQAS